MYSELNVIDFLSGFPYMESTLLDDVKITFDNIQNNTTTFSKDIILKLCNQLIIRRSEEIKTFYETINHKYECRLIGELASYYAYPFRTSRNAKAERDIITYFTHEDMTSYTDTEKFIHITQCLLMTSMNYLPANFYEDLKGLCLMNDGYNLNFDNMKTARFVGRIGEIKFPDTFEEAMKLYLYWIDYFMPELVGFLGEYYAYEYIIKHHMTDPNDRICWVSKELGDGYGYDIIVFNFVTHKYTAYEVKAHKSPNRYEEYYISGTENREREKSLNENYDYKVINYLLNEKGEPTKMDIGYYNDNGTWQRDSIDLGKLKEEENGRQKIILP